MSEQEIDIAEVMAKIRRRAKEELAKEPQKKRFVAPTQALRAGDPLISSEELRYLNEHWHDWNNVSEITSHRKIIGPIIVRAKKFIADIIWNTFLRGYIERERDFQMRLVRYLNQVAKYVDEGDKSVRVDLINKIDSDLFANNERIDVLCSEVLATAHQIESNTFAQVRVNEKS